MMIPVRCFSCGQVVADKWEEFDRRVHKNGEDPGKVLDELGVKRYCCRRMLISHIDLIDEVIDYGRK
jgi:DNA-directed RNA polymerase, subunit N (EC 2.7.7.6)